MQRWVEATHPDYAIEWITPDGAYPEDRLADMAHLRGVLVNDAPMEGVPVEARTVSFEEIRADEARWRGVRQHSTRPSSPGTRRRAKRSATPRCSGTPTIQRTLNQGATAVDPKHRGHALGRQLKAAMYQRIVSELPGYEFIRTFNADSNAPMLAVNNAMGFAPYAEARRWVISTSDALAWLEKRT